MKNEFEFARKWKSQVYENLLVVPSFSITGHALVGIGIQYQQNSFKSPVLPKFP